MWLVLCVEFLSRSRVLLMPALPHFFPGDYVTCFDDTQILSQTNHNSWKVDGDGYFPTNTNLLVVAVDDHNVWCFLLCPSGALGWTITFNLRKV